MISTPVTLETMGTCGDTRGFRAEWRGEPALDDILSDPVVHLVMRRDRLDPEEVRRFMRHTADRMRSGDRSSTPPPGPMAS